MNVLSLFDGISCGMVALERAGIQVDKYYASEIDPHAIKISEKNYPNIIRLGDVTKWREWDIDWAGIDLLIGGSPCQDLCSCGSREGLSGVKSSLFFCYADILENIKRANSRMKFLLENNASMTKENKDKISEIVGVQPVLINSNIFSAQDRKRLYWCNFNIYGLPDPCGKVLRDIVQPEIEKQEYNITERIYAKKKGTLAYTKAWKNVRTLDQKSKCLLTSQSISNTGATNIKYSDDLFYKLTPLECERLQTLPDGYTSGVSNTARYAAIGNGWTVDVIAHILKCGLIDTHHIPML